MPATDAWIEKWNRNFSRPEYAYGKAPNAFLQRELDKITPQTILFAAEGEGRNAVYAARRGWQVSAFDISAAGREKALRLAAEHGVTLDYALGELPDLGFNDDSFDALALIYAHFPAEIKSRYHRLLAQKLKKGGVIIFEAFSKNHLAYRHANPEVGGPADADSLFSLQEVAADFRDFDAKILQEEVITLSEGLLHNGTGAVIRFVGIKR